jgi:hypothetical protein
MNYDTAIAMAETLAERLYTRQHAGEQGEPFRAVGVATFVAEITRIAGDLGLKKPDGTRLRREH